jgi:hypothetical protein
MADSALARTRHSLHGIAELVLAGPEYRRSGTIRLAPRPGGFGTVAAPDLRIDGDALVAADRRFPVAGMTLGDLARQAGVEAGRPDGVYQGGSGASVDDVVEIEPAVARVLADCYARGAAALHLLVGDQTPVLWPEHFDLGISDNEINYGVSPGDSWLDEPYAYVGPRQTRTGEFWNAPFGAAQPMRQLTDARAVFEFMNEGRKRATNPLTA